MIAEVLRSRRQELHLTQQAVADHLHVTRQTVSNWETGKNYPDVPTLIELSNYYGLSLDYLLKGDAQMIQQLKKESHFRQTLQMGLFMLLVVLPLDFFSGVLFYGVAHGRSAVQLLPLQLLLFMAICGMVITYRGQFYEAAPDAKSRAVHWLLQGILLLSLLLSFANCVLLVLQFSGVIHF